MSDEERAAAVLRKALEYTNRAFVPAEIIMLVMLLYERLDPKDAVVAAYLLGKCDGDVAVLEQNIAETEARAANGKKKEKEEHA